MADETKNKVKEVKDQLEKAAKEGKEQSDLVDRDVSTGPERSFTDRQRVAEEKIARAMVEDQEDTREETSGDERHDLVSGKEINIPPTIQQERLRNGQNPDTGRAWSKEERMKYDKDNEKARQDHAKAVKESEQQMRKEQAEAQIQPVVHTPTAHTTKEQRDEMQKAQDSGKGPVAQAAARDNATPEKRGWKEVE